MAKLIVHNPPTVKLKASGYTGTPTGDIELTENKKTYNVSSFATATTNIPEPSGTKDIVENGNYNVKDFEFADVKVPLPTGETILTENNKSYDVTQYESAKVQIPEEEKTVTPSTVEQTVTPDNGLLKKVTVEPTPLESKTVTPKTEQQTIVPQSPAVGFSSVTVESAPEDTGEDGLYKAMLEGTVVDIYDNKLVSAIGFLGKTVPVKTVFLLKAENISAFDGNKSIKSIYFPKATKMPQRTCYECSALIDYIMPLALGATFSGDTGNQRHFANTPVRHIIVGWQYVGFHEYEGVQQIETYVMTKARQTGTPDKVLTNFHTCVLLTSNTTLDNVSMFSGTKIESGEGYIYVPEQNVVSYKNATNWSVYAERIVGIKTQTTVTVGGTFTPPIFDNIVSWDVIKLNSWNCGNVNSITGAFNATFVGFLLLRGLSADGNPLYVAYIEVTEAEHDN